MRDAHTHSPLKITKITKYSTRFAPRFPSGWVCCMIVCVVCMWTLPTARGDKCLKKCHSVLYCTYERTRARHQFHKSHKRMKPTSQPNRACRNRMGWWNNSTSNYIYYTICEGIFRASSTVFFLLYCVDFLSPCSWREAVNRFELGEIGSGKGRGAAGGGRRKGHRDRGIGCVPIAILWRSNGAELFIFLFIRFIFIHIPFWMLVGRDRLHWPPYAQFSFIVSRRRWVLSMVSLVV